MSISIGSFDFENTFINSKDGNIKGSTSKIKNKNVLFIFDFFVKTISHSSGCWLIENSLDSKSSNLTSIFGGLSLGIVEISRDSDNSILNFGVKMIFSNLFHFTENHRRDLFSMEFFGFVLELNDNERFSIDSRFYFERPEFDIFLDSCISELSTDKSFSVKDSVSWVSNTLIFGSFSNFSFSFSESNIGWSSSSTLFVFNNNDFVFFHDSNA